MNTYEATQNGLGHEAPWYFVIKEYVSDNGITNIIVEHGYDNNTQLIDVNIDGEFDFIEDVENALLQHDVFENALGPIDGGGYFPVKR
jgi:hypothetical protein